MKFHLLIIFILLFTFSCQDSESFIDNKKKLAYEDFNFELHLKGLSMEERCQNEKLRAEKDIKNGNLIHFTNYGFNYYYDGRAEQELNELLGKFNIKTDVFHKGCFRVKEFEPYEECYPKLMKKAIVEKFGATFIDSVSKVADSIYVIRRKNQTFNNRISGNGPSLGSYFTHKDKNYHDKIIEMFFHKFKYPKGYLYPGEIPFSLTTADFILRKDGSVDSLVVKSKFNRIENNVYRNYFEKSIKDYIMEVEWVPVTSYGMKLNTREHISLLHRN